MFCITRGLLLKCLDKRCYLPMEKTHFIVQIQAEITPVLTSCLVLYKLLTGKVETILGKHNKLKLKKKKSTKLLPFYLL